jgi:twinkle protein
MLNDRHSELLMARGLDVELLEQLGVSSSDRGGDWIEIPYLECGKRVNTKFRTIAGEKKFNQETGGRKCFWNIDVLADTTLEVQPLIITEGEFDAIVAMQCGKQRVISVPDGAPAEAQGAEDTGVKYSYVSDARPLLRDVKEIILATDDDGPGINLLNDLAIRLGKHRCKWLRYPAGCKDLNEVLQKHGQAEVIRVLDAAQWTKVGGVYRMSELPPVSRPPALKIGIAELDKHYKIRPGDFVVVTGVPSHGKTSFVNEIAARMASPPHNWSIAVASFEQNPQVDHRRNLRTFFNKKLEVWQSAEELARADAWIDQRFAFIVPDEDDDATLDWLLERAEAAIVQYGCRMMIADPWNEMDHLRPPDMSLTEYTGFAIKQFRKLARKYQVHVIVVAHPTKLRPEKAGERMPVPTLYDISDSAHWFNKADVGIIVHRTDEIHTLIRIQKTRYHDAIGVPGDLEARYLRESARFEVTIEEAMR